jgi:hypothetical protein
MIPVTLARVKNVEQHDRSAAKGWAATCSACGRCRVSADDGRTAGKSAKHAVSELARTCTEPGSRHYYRSRLPAGIRLEWSWRGDRRPAHLLDGRVCGTSGEVGRDSAVYVVVAPPPGATDKTVARLNRLAAAVADRVRKGWDRVILERAAVPQEATPA